MTFRIILIDLNGTKLTKKLTRLKTQLSLKESSRRQLIMLHQKMVQTLLLMPRECLLEKKLDSKT
jgi:hypothetical protein